MVSCGTTVAFDGKKLTINDPPAQAILRARAEPSRDVIYLFFFFFSKSPLIHSATVKF